MPEQTTERNIIENIENVAEEAVEVVENKPFENNLFEKDWTKPNQKQRVSKSIRDNIKQTGKKIKKEIIEIECAENDKEEDIKNIKKRDEGKNEINLSDSKIFNLYDISEVVINDPGLKNVINLNYKLLVKSHGRSREKFGKANVNIVERLINTVAVPGHRGKKHKIITKWASGKYNKNTKMVLEAFKIINEKSKKNPVQVLVTAIEKGSPMDEVTMIQYGGARYPQAVDCSPLRRVSLALRNIVHGAYDKSFRSKKKFSSALAEEIMLTAEGGNSVVINKKNELEKQADAAR